MLKKVSLLVLLFILLILVRFFENILFYDPFLFYFKQEYLYENYFPDYSMPKLLFFLLFRYVLNTAISLMIIYQIFKDIELVKFSVVAYSLLFVVLIIAYLVQLNKEFSDGYLAAFYIRRFLIQPLFLFLLIPAFLYQKKQNKNKVK